MGILSAATSHLAMAKINPLNPDYDFSQSFDSVNEAVEACYFQPHPVEALFDTVRFNFEQDEIGFASELLYEFGNSQMS